MDHLYETFICLRRLLSAQMFVCFFEDLCQTSCTFQTDNCFMWCSTDDTLPLLLYFVFGAAQRFCIRIYTR